VLKRLAKIGVLSVLIEGGGSTAGRALAERAVDKVLFFYAPKIIGAGGKRMIGDLEIRRMRQCKRIRDMTIEKFGEDLLVSGYLI
jgi:diaminohydroxyphosphoribosylaminopyrimidine deaminase/5-amino-6-(5-phosphoribosylamino)uracil reductase